MKGIADLAIAFSKRAPSQEEPLIFRVDQLDLNPQQTINPQGN